jgi:N-acetylneuraminic acid mutarotase
VVGGESMSPITEKPISSNFVETFDTANGWVNKNPLLDAQDNLLTCVYNNKIYTFAGNNQKTGYVSFGEQYDPQSIPSAWTKFDSMYVGTTPFSRKYCATCIWQNNLYLFGGVRGDFGDTVCRDIYVFNFLNQTWSKINQRMLSTRCYFQTAQFGGKIYLLGGIDSNSTTLQSTEIFDPVSQKCSPGPEMPIPLSSFTAVTINQQLYIMGGLDANSELVGTMYMFDSGLQTWSIKSPLPEPRYLMSASVINGNIFVTGGIITQSPILGQKSDQDFIEYYP